MTNICLYAIMSIILNFMGITKMKRKLLHLLMIICFTTSLISIINTSVYSADLTSGIFKYTSNSDGTVNITGFSGSFSGALTIPYKLNNGKVVKSVAGSAFLDNNNITELTVEAGVKTISEWAFRSCDNITKITINEGVTSIGEMSFTSCSSAKTISLPASLKSIGLSAFSGCSSLTGIDVASSNTSFCSYNGDLYNGSKTTIVQYCLGKTDKTFTVPSTVNHIGNFAFKGAKNLENITLPANLRSIGTQAFTSCSSLKEISFPQALYSIGESAFNGCSSLTFVELHEGVTDLGSGIFYNCTSLSRVILNEGIEYIADTMFGNCGNLKRISIPKSVETIYYGAFISCNNLLYVSYTGTEAEWMNISIYDNNTSLTEADIQYEADYSKFSYTLSEDEVTITGSAIKSGDLVIPSFVEGAPVTAINAYAFEGYAISSVAMPEHLETIGAYAFRNCAYLKEIKIPSSVTAIGDCVFTYCSNLEKIEVDPDNEAFSSVDGVLFNKSQTTLLQYPMAKRGSSYKTPSSVKTIGKYAFYNSSLTDIHISNGALFINNSGFEGCALLKTIRLPGSLVLISSQAFWNCNALEYIYINKTSNAWSGVNINSSLNTPIYNATVLCYTVTGGEATITDCETNASGKITVPKTVEENCVIAIGDSAFEGCSYITEINLPLSISLIGTSAFENCTSLSSINIPENVTYIGSNAFYGCNSLNPQIYYGGNENTWNNIEFGSVADTFLTSSTISYNCVYKSEFVKIYNNSGAISAHLIPNSEFIGKEIIFVAYKNKAVADIQFAKYKSDAPTFTSNVLYDEIKIMVWDSFNNMSAIIDANGYNISEI